MDALKSLWSNYEMVLWWHIPFIFILLVSRPSCPTTRTKQTPEVFYYKWLDITYIKPGLIYNASPQRRPWKIYFSRGLETTTTATITTTPPTPPTPTSTVEHFTSGKFHKANFITFPLNSATPLFFVPFSCHSTCHRFFPTSTYGPILTSTATRLRLHIFTFYGYHREEEEERERGWKEWGWAFIERWTDRYRQTDVNGKGTMKSEQIWDDVSGNPQERNRANKLCGIYTWVRREVDINRGKHLKSGRRPSDSWHTIGMVRGCGGPSSELEIIVGPTTMGKQRKVLEYLKEEIEI
ncbi:hypothetical protein V1478_004902 [Vespula squamosa]|uniref:Uncharacterized protein n=1 Tax=Vespula squamosa TaxID=30214 RepID=A0ABD2BF33_VESSQ